MTSAFSSNEKDALQRTVDVHKAISTHIDKINEVYEINKCVEWIKNKNIEKVALQFPDDMLCDSAKVSHFIENEIARKVYILGDTSYGSCCVDEIAAEHAGANGIIHFGHSCLSPTKRLPVLHVFTPLHNSFAVAFMKQLESKDSGGLIDAFEGIFCDPSTTLLLAYDSAVASLMEKILQVLSSRFSSLIVMQLCVDTGSATESSSCGPFCQLYRQKRHSATRLGRSFCLPDSIKKDDPHIIPPLVYFGEDNIALDNLALTLRDHDCYQCYVNEDEGFSIDIRTDDNRNKFLRRRLFLVEKVREASVVGVVVGTLGTEGYLTSVEQVMSIVRASGRKCYLLAVGRPTPPKLANFLEIDVFVVIACPESARQLDLRGQFHRPVVTPYEVEVALCKSTNISDDKNQRRWEKWGGLDFIPDFRDMLPSEFEHGDEYSNAASNSERKNVTCETDVSLLSGRIRHFGITESDDVSVGALNSEDQNCKDVAVRQNMPLDIIHKGGGGEFLAGRSWKGLEVNKSDPLLPSAVVPGRLGTASGYRTEEESMEKV